MASKTSKTPEVTGYRVRIQRAGNTAGIPPFEVHSTEHDQLVQEIYDRARPLVSGRCEIAVGLVDDEDDLTWQAEGRARRQIMVGTIDGGRNGFVRFTELTAEGGDAA